MKVLMLGWELPPYNSGGLGVACYQLCAALAKTNVDIEFVVPYTASHRADFMQITPAQPQDVTTVLKAGTAYDSYKYIFTDGHEEWQDVYGQQQLYETAVAKLVEATDYDIVHAHDWLTFRAGLRAKEARGCPLILHVHSIESDRAGGHTGNPLVREIEATSMVLADKVVAVSEHTKQKIVDEYAIPPEKIKVIHNSIDVSGTLPVDQANAFAYLGVLKRQGYKVVANVGRLTIQKGLPNLLRAAQKVVQYQPKTMFLLVGAGEQYHELITQTAELGIAKNVIFTGFLRGKQWRDAFAIADLFVMPSISEPFGLTPLEAIGYGTPALISKQSGIAEILTSALKVDFWDEDEMANQIVNVLRSPALAKELLANAQREHQAMSWNQAADALTRLYKRHLAKVAA